MGAGLSATLRYKFIVTLKIHSQASHKAAPGTQGDPSIHLAMLATRDERGGMIFKIFKFLFLSLIFIQPLHADFDADFIQSFI